MANETFFHALEKGSQIDAYEIISVLGAGGFGITYKGHDRNLHTDVAIKEYLPSDLAMRAQDGSTVIAKTSSAKKDYEYGLKRFMDEARILAKFKEPNIVRVSRYLEANNTAYFVMDYEEGQSLSECLKSAKEPLSEERLKAIIIPILDGLRAVHGQKYLHRDIKPGNIYLRNNGSPVLLDFGAARQALSGHSQSITGVVTPGYGPFEQYNTRGKQGPWTDLYAIGATLYRCVAGRTPTEAPDRIAALQEGDADPLQPASTVAKGRYSSEFLATIDWMLSPSPKDRPQTVKDVLDRLVAGLPVPTPQTRTVSATATVISKGHTSDSGRRKGLIGIAVATAILVLAVGIALVFWPGGSAKDKTEIKRLLTLARGDFQAKRYIKPPGSNAYERYRQIQGIDPANPEARAGIKKIVKHFVGQARQAMTARRYRHVMRNYEIAAKLLPEAPSVQALGRDIEAAKRRVASGRRDSGDRRPFLRRDPVSLAKQAIAKKRYGVALRLLRRPANNGHAEAQTLLGTLYYRGWGVGRSYHEAANWYRRAAQRGRPDAQTYLGVMTQRGLGVLKDPKAAARWYRKAAALGNLNAQFYLAELYFNGTGVTRNLSTAAKWYRKAAERGHSRAQTQFGNMYFRGYGVPKSPSQAVYWYRKAAYANEPQAQANLGYMYETGSGVTKRISEAIRWYRKSAARGNASARAGLKRLGAL